MKKLIFIPIALVIISLTGCSKNAKQLSEVPVTKSTVPKLADQATSVAISEKEASRYVALLNQDWDTLQALNSRKVWRKDLAIGVPNSEITAARPRIGNKEYEFFVELPGKFNEYIYWFRTTGINEDFPRERVILIYDQAKKNGTLEYRFYSDSGKGELILDKKRALTKLDELIRLTPSIIRSAKLEKPVAESLYSSQELSDSLMVDAMGKWFNEDD